jgi:hypothetical protein
MKANIKHRIRGYIYLNGQTELIEYGISPLAAWNDEDDWQWLPYDKKDQAFQNALTLYKGIPCLGAVYLWNGWMHSMSWVYEL